MNTDANYEVAVVAGYLSAWLTAIVAPIPEERRDDVERLVDRLQAALAASVKEPADV